MTTATDPMPVEERLLHPIDVSLMLGVPRSTLANWRSARKGPPFVKVGRHVRYRRADVDQWLESQVALQPESVTTPR